MVYRADYHTRFKLSTMAIYRVGPQSFLKKGVETIGGSDTLSLSDRSPMNITVIRIKNSESDIVSSRSVTDVVETLPSSLEVSIFSITSQRIVCFHCVYGLVNERNVTPVEQNELQELVHCL